MGTMICNDSKTESNGMDVKAKPKPVVPCTIAAIKIIDNPISNIVKSIYCTTFL